MKKNNDIYMEIQTRLSNFISDRGFPEQNQDWLIKEILYEKIDQLVTNKDFLIQWKKMKAEKIDFQTLISRAVKLIN